MSKLRTRLAIVAVALAACSSSAPEVTTPDAAEAVESPATQAQDAERLPDRLDPQDGPASASCVNGWVTPERDSPLVLEAIKVIRRQMQVRGEFSLQDLRYFEGPESPPSDKGYILNVRRWYVKGHLKRDPALRGRWIVERREFGAGVAAVAPHDTEGFASPDWRGFQWSPQMEPKAYEGLPGEWAGVPYDFVAGGGDLDFPGLPAEVQGCLDGT